MGTQTLCLLTCVLLGLLGPGLASALDDAATRDKVSAGRSSDDEVMITLHVPLHSPLFAKTPVAVVDDEPITVRDLTGHIATVHAKQTNEKAAARKDYADLLERVITTYLIVHEARNMGLDETTEYQSEMDAFSRQLLISHLMAKQLAGVEPAPDEVDALYRQMSREFLLSTIKFSREQDALAFQRQLQSGADFTELARGVIHEGKAVGDLSGDHYMKLKDLLPQVAQRALSMGIGAVSQIFTAADGFLLFRVDDIRSYDDPLLKAEARRKLLAPLRKSAAAAYADSLETKYVTIDKRLLEKVSFEPEQTGFWWFRRTRPVDYKALLADSRVLATVHGDNPVTITVADLAAKLQQSFFHGIEKAVEEQTALNERKRITFKNMLFMRTATLEAVRQGLDQTEEYRSAVDEHARSLLFGAFVAKAVSPDVHIDAKEVRRYYQEHIGEFSTPKMFRMNDLLFYSRTDAEGALTRLQKGADFQWVSANSAGQVDKDNQDVARFDNVVLSETGLPDELREIVRAAEQGDALLYASPDHYYHVMLIRKITPPQARDYGAVQREIEELLWNQRVKELIDDWARQLKEVYETRIFVAELPD